MFKQKEREEKINRKKNKGIKEKKKKKKQQNNVLGIFRGFLI